MQRGHLHVLSERQVAYLKHGMCNLQKLSILNCQMLYLQPRNSHQAKWGEKLILTSCAEVHAHILGPCQQLISEVRVYLEETWESICKDVFVTLPKLKVAVLEQASIWFTRC